MIAQLTGGTILIVEDEPFVAEALKEVLEAAGFHGVTARDVETAIAVLEQNRARDLAGLVTDINLGAPGSGWQVAARARELNPALAVVYMSGDSAADWSAHGVPRSTALQKPFALGQVVVAISALINRSDVDG